MKISFFSLLVFGATLFLSVRPSTSNDLPLELIKLPPGFAIETFATNVVNARAMTIGQNGTLFVGSRSAGNIYALVDENQDMRSDKMYVVADRLHAPSGVAFKDGSLYASAVDRILRYDNIEALLDQPPVAVTVTT